MRTHRQKYWRAACGSRERRSKKRLSVVPDGGLVKSLEKDQAVGEGGGKRLMGVSDEKEFVAATAPAEC